MPGRSQRCRRPELWLKAREKTRSTTKSKVGDRDPCARSFQNVAAGASIFSVLSCLDGHGRCPLRDRHAQKFGIIEKAAHQTRQGNLRLAQIMKSKGPGELITPHTGGQGIRQGLGGQGIRATSQNPKQRSVSNARRQLKASLRCYDTANSFAGYLARLWRRVCSFCSSKMTS